MPQLFVVYSLEELITNKLLFMQDFVTKSLYCTLALFGRLCLSVHMILYLMPCIYCYKQLERRKSCKVYNTVSGLNVVPYAGLVIANVNVSVI